jgi:hypothetical protein
MKVNTGTLLVVVACMATSSYLLSSWTTESQRSRVLFDKLKETTALLLERDAEAAQCTTSEAELTAELVSPLWPHAPQGFGFGGSRRAGALNAHATWGGSSPPGRTEQFAS